MTLVFLFKALVVFTVLQRLLELFLAKFNERHIIQQGGFVASEKNYRYMVMAHVVWFGGLFYLAIKPPAFIPETWFYIFFCLFLLGQLLRVSAYITLGKNWSTRILILPNTKAKKKGIYKFLRHPNYIGVCLELFALPMMVGGWELAISISIVNLVILYFRIQKEEELLVKHNDYETVFNLQK